MIEKRNLLCWFWTGLFLLTSCAAPVSSAAPSATATPLERGNLNVSLLYPNESSAIDMGQTTKAIVRVTDEQDQPVEDAVVTVTFNDPAGQVVATIPATFGDGQVYRSDSWTVPHHMQEGLWKVEVEAETLEETGKKVSDIQVNYSDSEILYHKYGFWLDAPTLMGITPSIVGERGDTENGLIRWGGQIPSQHVLPENWVEVQWRKGNFNLDSPEAVRSFLLDEIGYLGFTPVREIGEFKRTQFKHWDAWEAPARGQLYYTVMEWTVFYAPEVDKTYALSTTVVNAPKGLDANEALLESFDIDPNIQVEGVAPEPLIALLPQPRLVSPELGAIFTGLEQPIVLQWEPVKELAADEYYQVTVDYDYEETNFLVKYSTRGTRFTLPEELYHLPNCSVFNWRITLMQQTGVDEDGNPVGQALSYDSLHWYVRWFYPLDEKAPFNPLCPNALF